MSDYNFKHNDPAIIQSKSAIGLERVDNLSYQDIKNRLKAEGHIMQLDGEIPLSTARPIVMDLKVNNCIRVCQFTEDPCYTSLRVQLNSRNPFIAILEIIKSGDNFQIVIKSLEKFNYKIRDNILYLEFDRDDKCVCQISKISGDDVNIINDQVEIPNDLKWREFV